MALLRPAGKADIVIAESGYAPTDLAKYAGWHALSPILIGLALPLALFLIAKPAVLENTRALVSLIMFVIALLAGAVFIASLLQPGTTVAVTFNRDRRMAEVIRAGLFAHVVYAVPFARIVAVRIETHYDDDGYKTNLPRMILTPREIIDLPASATPRDIAAINQILQGG